MACSLTHQAITRTNADFHLRCSLAFTWISQVLMNLISDRFSEIALFWDYTYPRGQWVNMLLIATKRPQWQVLCSHDDVIKWKHFPRYWPFVRGIHRSPVNSPHKGQWRQFSLICTWINVWVNNGKGGGLRGNRAYYDVTVMGNPNFMITQAD